MKQFITISGNAFMELVRQPVFLILMTSSAVFIAFLASVYYFGFGDDQKMVKDSVLAVMLLAGLFGAVLSAASSVANEIRRGTALAVLSKPVGRSQFLLAKFLGLAGSLTLLSYTNLLSALLASRMAYDAYGEPDKIALAIFFGCIVAAYVTGGFSNYFLRRPFVSDGVFALVGFLTLAFILINFIDKGGAVQAFGAGIDWRIVPAGILVLFALWLLAGVALACSTRLEMVATLGVCSGVFLLGLTSDYFFGQRAEAGSWWAGVAYALLPNWQLFWMADALEGPAAGGKRIPWGYVAQSFGYVVAYLGATLSLALILFEDRELH